MVAAPPEYDFEVEHIKGLKNYSDFLSRAFKCNLLEEDIIKGLIEVKEKQEQIRLLENYHKETGYGGKERLKYLLKQKYS